MTTSTTTDRNHMSALVIERSGGFIGATECVRVDDLDADSPTVHVESFGGNQHDHALLAGHRDQLRAAREQLRSDVTGSGGHPHGADRYVWTVRIDGAPESITFHEPLNNAGARTMAGVAAQLFVVA